MARKKGIGAVFLVIIVIGFGMIGLSFLETPFPDIVPLSLLQRFGCDPDQVECFSSHPRIIRSDQVQTPFALPLQQIDTTLPMIIEYQTFPVVLPASCIGFEGDIDIMLTDENGDLVTIVKKGRTDIQPLLKQGQQTLIRQFIVPTCPTDRITYEFEKLNPDGTATPCFFPSGQLSGCGLGTGLRFTQKAPELREFANPLLAQSLFLSDRDQEVVETAQRFAVAESFQLVDPTVITDLRVQIDNPLSTSLTDLETSITAFVWNLDKTPPERVVQSAETFTGLTRDFELDFTFPNAVVLLAVENDQQITYGVGIRVDQNIGQEFAYQQANLTAVTHECVIDRNSATDSESMFTSNGICGFDIFHSQFLASQILAELPDPNDPATLTRPELVALLCEGITPEPIICQGIDTTSPTAGSCGVTEIFFNRECICAPTFFRQANGQCVIADKSNLPDLLQISEFSFNLLVIAGGIVVGLGILGIIVRRRR